MWTSQARCIAAIAVAGVLWTARAQGEPTASAPLAQPAMVSSYEQKLTLPAEKPRVELASYWRHAKPLRNAQTKPQRTAQSQPPTPQVPPEPAPLAQPSWLLPDEPLLSADELTEPPGEAVYIDDEEPSINEVIELAMANVELAPPRATALLVVARELADEASSIGDYGDVIDQCHRALDAGPDKATATSLANLAAWAHNRRGELVAAAGDEHAAFEEFQEAIRLNPHCWPALHNRGVTLARYAKQAEALADFNRVVDLAPQFVVARYNRGEVLSQLGRWQEAVDDYTVALQSMPDEAALFAGRGYALHQVGRTREAASDFNTAIRLDSAQADAYVGRGNLYASEGMYEQAAADFQQALRLAPDSAPAYRSAAWLLATCPLERYRSPDKAVEAAHRVAKMMGEDDPSVLDTLAVAYAAAGDFHQAITYQQQAIVLADDAQRSTYEHRLALYRQGKPYRTK